MNKCICFAYFGDDKFLGWYADSFGSIRPNSPKLYRNNEHQIDVIKNNFRYKLNKLNEHSKLGKNESIRGLSILDNSLNDDKDELLQYKKVELRIVECPHYDGPNPDFNKEEWQQLMDKRHTHMEELGIFDIPAPSRERSVAVKKYDEDYPSPKCENWIYVDYSLVKEWASKEPTEFLSIIDAKEVEVE